MHMQRLLTACLMLLAAPAAADKLAFILGNAAYEELSSLDNTLYDAAAYRDTFRDLGYEVTFHENLALEPMLSAFDTFLASVNPGDEVAFIYAGHGWSDGQFNYLIPTDAPKKGRDRMLVRHSLALKNGHDGVLDELARADASLSLAIIDACRDNPFEPKEGTRSSGMSRGLAPIDPLKGTFVVFSAGAGQQALDRLPTDPPDQRLSVFTRTFLPHLQSGLYLEQAISKAQVETAALARQFDGHLQHPAYYDETLGDTCIAPSCGDQTAVLDRCDQLYEAAQAADACFAYDGYVSTCPTHLFAPFATSYLERNCKPTLPDPVKPVDPVVAPDPPKEDPKPPVVVAIDPEANNDVQLCDALALDKWHPDARSGVSKSAGIAFTKMDASRAISACQAAKAAFPDHLRTRVNLGRAYHSGKRYAEALTEYDVAIAGGDMAALYLSGILYATGRGTTRDDSKALDLYQRGTDLGYAPTINALGTMYFNGRGVTKDVKRATELFRQASDMGFAQAHFNYALQLEKNPATRQQAAELFFLSLQQGRDFAAKRDTRSWNRDTAKALQLLLRDEGLYTGAIDGIMGSGGKAAMRALIPD